MKKVWAWGSKKKMNKRALKKFYLSLLPEIRKIAKRSGYAIGVHGSLTRDFDLLALPWVKYCVNPETLAMRISQGICKYPYGRHALRMQPQNKPHGRVSYVLPLGGHGEYIDISIIAIKPVIHYKH